MPRKAVCRRVLLFNNPVDGNWSGWGSYSHCDVTCGTGWKLRRRNCTNPPPSGGGGDCVGLDEEGILCLNKPCPIDGAWSAWSRYSTCSVSCGGGNRERNRTCNNPEPSNGGRDCTGNSTMSETCNTSICPGWGSWGPYTPCSKPCGAGRKYRFRTCQGQNATFCDGLHYQYASCNLEACSESFG
ncbi:coadhesin-like [Saccostrea cucullata]|uniref:coadhesin-like n=1 Tax=Saccostrea cuccullata TaxID=36930 RepID=UPI002ED45CC2